MAYKVDRNTLPLSNLAAAEQQAREREAAEQGELPVGIVWSAIAGGLIWLAIALAAWWLL